MQQDLSELETPAESQSACQIQGWFGGNSGPIWPPAKTRFKDMTAIALIYAPSGFALAADGRYRLHDSSSYKAVPGESDSTQKIFAARLKGKDMAYALTGAVSNEQGTFNLVREVDNVMHVLCDKGCQNIYELLQILSIQLKAVFDQAKKDGRLGLFRTDIAEDDGTFKISSVFVAGYDAENGPSCGKLGFFHKNQIISEPTILVESPPQHNWYSGSDIIAELVCEGKDQRFLKYGGHLDTDSPIRDVVAVARGYIEACCDPLAVTIDPVCVSIGGHIHVATITRQDGFQWVSGYEPA